MTHNRLVNNLAKILAEDLANKQNEDIMFLSVQQITVLQSSEEVKGHENEVNFVNQQALVVVWDNDADWYLGFFIDQHMDGMVHNDHFEQVSANDRISWKRPRSVDMQDVKLIQIIFCAIENESDLTKE